MAIGIKRASEAPTGRPRPDPGRRGSPSRTRPTRTGDPRRGARRSRNRTTLDRARGVVAPPSPPSPATYPPGIPLWDGPDPAFLLDAEFDDAEDWLTLEPAQRVNRAILDEELDLA